MTRYYRKRATRVRGYVGPRVGGYSYSPEDVINTYGNVADAVRHTNSYRDPYLDRQTPSGHSITVSFSIPDWPARR